MKWGYPDLLPWLLLILPLAWLVFRLTQRREALLNRLISKAVWDSVAPRYAPAMVRRKLWMWLAAMLSAAIALARPQWGFRWEEVKRRGLDIVVVLDTSRSMLAPDFRPSRLQHAKWGIRDFIQRLKADRVGLVVFAGSAFLQCPLTIDYAAFLMLLDDVHCGIIPRGGTAIEQGLRAAMRAFQNEGEADRVILLVSDGEDHEGNPLALLDELKQKNIRVYAVGIGTPEGELLPAAEEQGGTFFKDRQGRVVKSALNEGVLERLALETGGMYVRAMPGDFGANRIYEQSLVNLRRDERESQLFKVYEDRFPWFIALSLLLLMIEALLPPQKNSSHAVKTTAVAAGALLFVYMMPSNGLAGETEARRAMREGMRHYAASNYEAAAKAFAEAAEKAGDTSLDPAVARYNEATALLNMQQIEQGAAKIQDAVRTSDLRFQQQAWYNRGWALYKTAEQEASKGNLQLAYPAAEQAIVSYQNAIRLQPDDTAAKVNYELALKLKEQLEIQKQQQEQQQQQEPQNQKRDEKSQQEQRSESSDSPEERKPTPSETQNQQEKDRESAQQQSSQDVKMEEMTREEAERILDALKQEENRKRADYRVFQAQPVPVEKDW
jgi:Ca-activated chloride channel family protein